MLKLGNPYAALTFHFVLWTWSHANTGWTGAHGADSAFMCLPNHIPSNKVKNLSIDGVTMPVKIAVAEWTSGRLVAKAVDIILRLATTADGRSLGYATEFHATFTTSPQAWMMLADCNATTPSGACYPGPLGSGSHLAFEVWNSYSHGMHEKLTEEVPDRVPIRIGYPNGMGVEEAERMVMKESTVAEASQDQIFLKWYESWKGVDLSLYFADHTGLEYPDWTIINYQLQGAMADMYIDATGDTACCWTDKGQRQWHLHNGWALSPACRKLVEQGRPCVPFISYQGWGYSVFLQFAFFFDMPIAFGSYARDNWVRISKEQDVLFFLWIPDDTFIDVDAKEIIFPKHNPDEHDQGIYKTQATGGKLWKMTHAVIPAVDPLLHIFMKSFALSVQNLMGLIQDVYFGKIHGSTEEEAVCKWLSENRAIWEDWVPDPRSCVVSQGLVDNFGQYVTNFSAGARCEFCSSGRQSVSISSSSGPIFVCDQCKAGSFAKSSGMTKCTPCERGRFAAVAGTDKCTQCPIGEFNGEEGQTSCNKCLATTSDLSAPCGELRIALISEFTGVLAGGAKAFQDGFLGVFIPKVSGQIISSKAGGFSIRVLQCDTESTSEGAAACVDTVNKGGVHVIFAGTAATNKAIIAAAQQAQIPNIHQSGGNPLMWSSVNNFAYGIHLPFIEYTRGPLRMAALRGFKSVMIIRSVAHGFSKASCIAAIQWARDAGLEIKGPSLKWCQANSNQTGTCRIVGRQCRCGNQAEVNPLEGSGVRYQIEDDETFYEVDERLLGNGLAWRVIDQDTTQFFEDIFKDVQDQREPPDIVVNFAVEWHNVLNAMWRQNFAPKMLVGWQDGVVTNWAKANDTNNVEVMNQTHGFWAVGFGQWHKAMNFRDPLFVSNIAMVQAYVDRFGIEPSYDAAGAVASGVVLYQSIRKHLDASFFNSSFANQREALRIAIGNMNGETLWGSVRWNRDNQNVGRSAGAWQLSVSSNGDAQQKCVSPPEAAEMELYTPFPTWQSRFGCPAGTFNAQGNSWHGDSCIPCPMGRVQSSRAPAMKASACQTCPRVEGLDCRGEDGVWIQKGHSSEKEISVYRCHGNERRCPGGRPGHTCARGRKGVACFECKAGHTPAEDGTCSMCAGPDLALFLSLCVIGFILLCCVYVFMDRRDFTKLSHSMLTAWLAVSVAVIMVQLLGVISSIALDWPEPVKTLMNIVELINFKIDILRIHCVFTITPLSRFVLKASVIVVVGVAMLLIHTVSVLIRYKGNFAKRRKSFINSIGAIFSVFYISVVATVLGPMQCVYNPNGKMTSQEYNSTVCWEGGHHLSMVVVGALATTIPVAFLMWCALIVFQFPKKVSKGDLQFLRCYAFLFYRCRFEVYWYPLVQLVRSLLIALAPVIPEVGSQILSIQVVLFGQLYTLIYLKPWRIDQINVLEATFTILVSFVLSVAGLLSDAVSPKPFAILVLIIILGVFLLVFMCVVLATLRWWRELNQKPFRHFICHAKLGGGSFARLLKMHLRDLLTSSQKVFVDTDDLRRLDKLFDYIASQTETLVILMSKDIFMRSWCVGEVVTCKSQRVSAAPVRLPDYSEPSEDFLDNYEVYVPGVSMLTAYGIDVPMIQETIRWINKRASVIMPPRLSQSSLMEMCSVLVEGSSRFSTLSPGNERQSINIIGPQEVRISNSWTWTHQNTAVSLNSELVYTSTGILVELANYNALCVALIVQKILFKHFMDERGKVPIVLDEKEPLQSLACVLVICANGTFHSPQVLRSLLAIGKLEKVKLVPILADDSFRFPTAEFVLENRSAAALVHDDPEGLLNLVLDVFKSTALVFQPEHYGSTEEILEAKALELKYRMMKPEILQTVIYKRLLTSIRTETSIGGVLSIRPTETDARDLSPKSPKKEISHQLDLYHM